MKQLSTAAVLVCAIFVQSSLAADFVLLHSFGHVGTASDTPAALTLSGSSLIGTSTGTDGAIHGTVFRLNTDGTVFTTLHTFGGGDNDGASPGGALVVSNGKLFGTTTKGGGDESAGGTVYTVDLHRSTFALLHRFADADADGQSPAGGLTCVGTLLYGMTEFGGGKGNADRGGAGVIYRLNADGSNFTRLHVFADGPDDGANPIGGLAAVGPDLYGVAQEGGHVPNGDGASGGVLFRIDSDGGRFQILHRFVTRDPGGTTPEGSLVS